MSASVKPATNVELIQDGNVATIRFSCESGVNIFTSQVLGDLGTVVGRLAEMPMVRFVVVRGQGRTFLAGADISEMFHSNEDQGHAITTHGHHVFNALESLPQVTIAALNGHALGGGCELALACDFRIVVKTAKIGQPECRLGLIPGWGGTSRLPKLIGLGRARRMLYTGEALSAQDAEKIGLVDEVVDDGEALDAALPRWFEMLAAGSPAAIRRIKHAMREDDEINQFGLSFSCSDAKEGMQAFLDKRQPNWSHWADCAADS